MYATSELEGWPLPRRIEVLGKFEAAKIVEEFLSDPNSMLGESERVVMWLFSCAELSPILLERPWQGANRRPDRLPTNNRQAEALVVKGSTTTSQTADLLAWTGDGHPLVVSLTRSLSDLDANAERARATASAIEKESNVPCEWLVVVPQAVDQKLLNSPHMSLLGIEQLRAMWTGAKRGDLDQVHGSLDRALTAPMVNEIHQNAMIAIRRGRRRGRGNSEHHEPS